jgi:hypothetical protein
MLLAGLRVSPHDHPKDRTRETRRIDFPTGFIKSSGAWVD